MTIKSKVYIISLISLVILYLVVLLLGSIQSFGLFKYYVFLSGRLLMFLACCTGTIIMIKLMCVPRFWNKPISDILLSFIEIILAFLVLAMFYLYLSGFIKDLPDAIKKEFSHTEGKIKYIYKYEGPQRIKPSFTINDETFEVNGLELDEVKALRDKMISVYYLKNTKIIISINEILDAKNVHLNE